MSKDLQYICKYLSIPFIKGEYKLGINLALGKYITISNYWSALGSVDMWLNFGDGKSCPINCDGGFKSILGYL